ncbi:MAG TPA: enoyl-CoA hydratase-related protein [Longimicrobiaceae bacterium]|nr:enoyl-CoA hydratase-related protein [Longimicrobiaceae bacterium]
MAEYSSLLFDVQDGIATITVNRPDKLNALTHATVAEIGAAAEEIGARDDVRGAIITGSGEKAFVAGADISELATVGALEAIGTARAGQAAFRALELSRKPIIAAVNGFALGGGCELALACHMRIASENARFGLPEVKLGLIPGYGGTVRLPRIVGKGRALELMLAGAPIMADEAYRIGLVNRVVPLADLLETARTLLKAILANGPVAVGLAIESATRGMEMDVDSALALEAGLFGVAAGTEDMREGTRAFVEKRAASFTGK